MRHLIAITLIAALTACSSSGAPAAEGVAPAAGPSNVRSSDLELRIVNVSGNTVSAFVLWRGANAVRLGDIGTGRTRVFETPFRGTEVAIVVDETNAPPRGTAGLGTGVPGQNTYAPVQAGDVVEFTVRRTQPTVQITYLILD
jgi:hypothetical protein